MTGLRIAMIGQRGVPATFGGVEVHVAEIGARLAARGHDVTVYCRTNYVPDRPPEHRGMTLRHLPTGNSKHFDAIVHSALSSFAALGRGFDIVHYHALGPGLLTPVPQYGSRAKVVQTIHGLDHDRTKWGGLAQRILKTAAWMSARVPDTTIVVSQALQEHFRARYARATAFIPNGVAVWPAPGDAIVRERFGLTPRRYFLFVGRLVPEKAVDMLMRAFRRLPDDAQLVIAGGSNFTDSYVALLNELAATDPRITMAGYVYGDTLHQLYANAAAFVLPSALEGMPLTLLEASSFGAPVIASDIPPHREVLGTSRPGARIFTSGSEDELHATLAAVIADPIAEHDAARAVREHIVTTYSWDAATEATEAEYLKLVAGTRRARKRGIESDRLEGAARAERVR